MLLNLLTKTAISELALIAAIVVIVIISALFSSMLSALYNKIFGKWGFIVTGWIGVSIHELTHALFCLVFRHKITQMSLFNPVKGDNAGFVKHSFDQKSIYQSTGNFFISFSPLISAPLLSSLVYYLLVKDNLLLSNFLPQHFSIIEINRFALLFYRQLIAGGFYSLIWIYITVSLAAHMNLSFEDIKISLKGGFLFFLIAFPFILALNYFGNTSFLNYLRDWGNIWLSFFIIMESIAFAISLFLLIINLALGFNRK